MSRMKVGDATGGNNPCWQLRIDVCVKQWLHYAKMYQTKQEIWTLWPYKIVLVYNVWKAEQSMVMEISLQLNRVCGPKHFFSFSLI